MRSDRVLLLIPPGWTLCTGGPHIALPLLAGFLRARGVPVTVKDLNIGASTRFGSSITAQGANSARRSGRLRDLNVPFFSAQEALKKAVGPFGATWDPQQGFCYEDCDLASSQSVRDALERASPFQEYFQSDLYPAIVADPPAVVGISVTVPGQLLPALQIGKFLKACGFRGAILLGGNTITRLATELPQQWLFQCVDGLVTYQGEEVLYSIWHAQASGASFQTVPNLVWLRDGEITVNPAVTLSPAKFCGPDFDELPVTDYWGVPHLPMLASRGCYYGKCTFCAIPYAWGSQGFIGNDSPENIKGYMRTASQKWGINRFKFVDEALHPRVMEQVAIQIIDEELTCEFEGYARFEKAWSTPRFLSTLAKAGLRKIYLGLELYPSASRDLLNKSDNPEVLDTLHALTDVGIKVHTFCMIGFPGTGVDEAMTTIEFALRQNQLIDSLDIFPFYYAKHTAVERVRKVARPYQDWALTYDYVPTSADVLRQEEVDDLAHQLEEVVWREKPMWLHPVYRLVSPWRTDTDSASYSS